MVAMVGVNLTLLVLSEYGVLPFAWSWMAVVGTLGTIGLSLLLTALSRR
jgi:Trk-type K+ transport system membrane component